MSKNRFKFLLSHLTFDDYQVRQERCKLDPFAAIRDAWEIFNDNLGKYLASSEYEPFDETLYLMHYQMVFHQYNPQKTHHYRTLRATHTHTYQFPMLQSQRWTKTVLCQVYH